MFQSRTLLIATKHHKEQVIAPILERELGLNCYVSTAFDTDSLGTFSGEIERNNDALTTVRNKCIEANKLTNCDLIVASEGSFGAHPTIFFAHADEEIIMFKDFKNNLEIVAREISLETNFNGEIIQNKNQLIEFAKKVQFPSHAIILKSSEKKFEKIFKGITNRDDLLSKYEEIKNEYDSVYAETDMRAMYNPMRMKVIEKATLTLIEKIKNECPKCTTPGFDVIKANPGLRCDNCNMPTRSILSLTYQCKNCNYAEEKVFPKGKKTENPMYCDFCNP
jgi:hypothetical protein